MWEPTLCKRAPLSGALFICGGRLFGLCLGWGLLWANGVAAAVCEAEHIDEYVRVDYVVDGDTLALDDGRRLRLIGLDTPELGRATDREQPLADEARHELRALLNAARRIGLQYDIEREDKYRRTLAHAFLDNGENLTAQLLGQGLAVSFVVPPNLWGQACYARQEMQARAQGRGLWALPSHQVRTVPGLGSIKEGIHRLTGAVVSVREHQGGQLLSLGGEVMLHIDPPDMIYFNNIDMTGLIGRQIRVKGWLHRSSQGWRMQLRHPAVLHTLDTTGGE
jgi:endonuclease YncB( thermonuclease family)